MFEKEENKSIKRVQAAKPEESTWKVGEEIVSLHTLSDEHLQNAFLTAEKNELNLFNKMTFWGKKAAQIEEEAKNRDINLKDYGAKYFENKRKLEVKKQREEV